VALSRTEAIKSLFVITDPSSQQLLEEASKYLLGRFIGPKSRDLSRVTSHNDAAHQKQNMVGITLNWVLRYVVWPQKLGR
jgi:hypothetical protein